jgi:hypothetical protein
MPFTPCDNFGSFVIRRSPSNSGKPQRWCIIAREPEDFEGEEAIVASFIGRFSQQKARALLMDLNAALEKSQK